MPIVVDVPIRVLSQDEFHALDHRVMGVIFEIHNRFGKLLHEDVFKAAISHFCRSAGIGSVQREVPIHVSHGSFRTTLRMDLLVSGGLMIEAKSAEAITPAHRAQALQYLFLTGMQHGRLVNLRTERVQHEFVSTTLDAAARRDFSIDDDDWQDLDERSVDLRRTMVELLFDWGAFLHASLYRDAVVEMLGGPARVIREIEILADGQPLGRQPTLLLNDDTAVSITTMHQGRGTMLEHYRRFLHHTRLRWLQWINLNRHRIEFRTIAREDEKKTNAANLKK